MSKTRIPEEHAFIGMEMPMKTKSKREDVVARLVLYGVAKWSKKQRLQVVNWLRRNAMLLARHPEELRSRYVARFLRTPKE